MLEEYEKKKRKDIVFRRRLTDYGLGALWTGAGLFFFFRHYFKIRFNVRFPPNDIDIIFGSICILYGIWRIYRGYKKNYFR